MRQGQDEQEFVSDFDTMMARAKELKGKRKKKNGVDIINDNEEHISVIVRQVRKHIIVIGQILFVHLFLIFEISYYF